MSNSTGNVNVTPFNSIKFHSKINVFFKKSNLININLTNNKIKTYK